MAIEATTWVVNPGTDGAYSPIIRSLKCLGFGDYTEVALYYTKLNKLGIRADQAEYLPQIIQAFAERYGAFILNQVWGKIEWL